MCSLVGIEKHAELTPFLNVPRAPGGEGHRFSKAAQQGIRDGRAGRDVEEACNPFAECTLWLVNS